MNHLATFFLASLFFHASSPSSQNIEPTSTLRITSEEFLQNISLAVGLSQVFKAEEVGMKAEHFSPLYNTSMVPFVFPISDSYDMDLSTKLSKKTGITPQRIFGILVQIIHTLLQFHIKRLFKLDPSEPFIPHFREYNGDEWEDDPQHWFSILFDAIMPGAIFRSYTYAEPVEVNRLHAKLFQFLTKGNKLYEYSVRKDGMLEDFFMIRREETPTVPVNLLPAHLLGKELPPSQPILTTISLERGYPHCKEILDHLLQGINFTFDLKHAELEVIVEPTKDIPSVEESMNILKKLFKAPIATQIMIPSDIESVLQRGVVPRASCYHPTNVLFGSPEIYERMLTLIITGGISAVLTASPDGCIESVAELLKNWLKIYLPDSSIALYAGMEDTPKRHICTYVPEHSGMWIYSGDIIGKATILLLNLGKPMMLNHIQMTKLRQNVFPHVLQVRDMGKADTPAKKILKAILKRLKEPMKVEKQKHASHSNLKGKKECQYVEQLEQIHP